jgi:hypothetical protein
MNDYVGLLLLICVFVSPMIFFLWLNKDSWK